MGWYFQDNVLEFFTILEWFADYIADTDLALQKTEPFVSAKRFCELMYDELRHVPTSFRPQATHPSPSSVVNRTIGLHLLIRAFH